MLTKLRSAGFLLWSPQPAGFLWEGEGWRAEKTAVHLCCESIAK